MLFEPSTPNRPASSLKYLARVRTEDRMIRLRLALDGGWLMSPNTWRRNLTVLMLLLAAGSTIYVSVWMVASITQPNPIEYRENAMVLGTALMCDGGNPFTLEHQPVFTNLYGIAFHWFVYPLAKLFGATFLIHRIVACVSLLAACVVLALALRHDGISKPYFMLGGLLLFAELACTHAVAGRPDMPGLLLLMLSVFVPWRWKFSTKSLAVAAAFTILGFYTKPYYLVGLPILASYLFLFRSKIRGIAFAACTLTALGLTTFAIQALYPAYFTTTFIIHLNAFDGQWSHLKLQLLQFTWPRLGMIALLVAAIVSLRKRRSEPTAAEDSQPQEGFLKRLTDVRAPLCGWTCDLSTWALVCGTVVIVGRLGWHTGSGQAYWLQLISPFLLWTAIRWLDCEFKKALPALLAALFSVAAVIPQFPAMPEDSREAWARLDRVFAAHDHIYSAPLTAHLVSAREGPSGRLYHTGQTDYSRFGTQQNFLAHAPAYLARCEAFKEQIAEAVRARAFDAVVITQGYHTMLPYQELREHYDISESIMLRLPLKSWKVAVLLPKKGSK